MEVKQTFALSFKKSIKFKLIGDTLFKHHYDKEYYQICSEWKMTAI